jgi:hypothetical protein
MSIRSYRVSNLLIWTCVASYVEFCLFEKLQAEFFAFLAWFMHCQQGGEVWDCFGLLNAFRRFSIRFEPFLGSGVHRSDRLRSPVQPVRVLVLFTCWASVWPVVSIGLTGQSWDDAAALFSSSGWHAFVQKELHWFRGSLHVCRGSSLWFSILSLVVCALCLNIVLSRMCWAVALA